MNINITLEEAVRLLLRLPVSPAVEAVPVEQANGRILAEDIFSPEMLPPFPRSPYDGYAFRGEDTAGACRQNPVTLRIIEEIPAGKAPTKEVRAGEAAKILTGAPIPPGANATIKYENTEFSPETVTFFTPTAPNTDIVPAGEDVSIGDCIGKKGAYISPPMAGLFAGLNIAEVPVFKRPVIAIVSTGDELLGIREPLQPAKIRNSSYYMLRAYLEQSGAEVLENRIVSDKTEEIANVLREVIKQADMVITTGGVSVGDYDMVRAAADSIGAETLFWRVRMKPGSAVLAAVCGGKLILGLSGNPAAAAQGLFTIGLPFLRKLSGRAETLSPKIKVKLLEPFKKSSPQRRFIWGRLCVMDGVAYFAETGMQHGGVVSSLTGADLLGDIPAGSPPLEAGTPIEAYRIGGC